MFKEKENKWTRPRGFWEVNGPDLAVLLTAAFFLIMTVGGIAFVIIQPRVRGLHELFSDPPPVAAAPVDQKLHLAPGETEMKLYSTAPAKPPENKK
jgi:hypothetical protein